MIFAIAAGLILLVLVVVLQTLLLLRRPAEPDLSELDAQMMALSRSVDHIGQAAERSRAALSEESRASREELSKAVRQAETSLQIQLGEGLQRHEAGLARTEQALNARMDSFTQATQQSMAALRAAVEQASGALRQEMTRHLGESRQESAGAAARLSGQLDAALQNFNTTFIGLMTQLGEAQQTRLNELRASLDKSIETSQGKLEAVRQTVEAKLQQIQSDNAQKLDQMRATVDEKLQGTLETAPGRIVQALVSERLEQVHKGLGEMQSLADGRGRPEAGADQRQDPRHLGRGAAGSAAGADAHARAVRSATWPPEPTAA